MNGTACPGRVCRYENGKGRCVDPPKGTTEGSYGHGSPEQATSDLSSSRKVGPEAASPGTAVQYTLTIINSGDVATAATLTDPLPAALVYIDGSGTASSGVLAFDPSGGAISWSGDVPAGGSVDISYQLTVSEDPALSGTLVSTATLTDLGTETSYALQTTLAVEAPPEPTRYVWEFTLTPTGISIVNTPVPESVAAGLADHGVERLVLLEGELPPFLAMDETAWTVAGMVMDPGFLPFITAVSSSALYAGVREGGEVGALLAVLITVTQSSAGGFLGTPTEPDRDYDTVPDALDACPDVPGDPTDPVSPGCPSYEEDEGYYDEEPDSDGDGIPDYADLCPHEPGPWDEDTPGCP